MSRYTHWFRKFAQARSLTRRACPRVRLAVEALEDRLVPSVNPTGDVAQIPYTSHSGPTSLGINFDGENFYSQGGFLGIGSQSIKVGPYVNGSISQTDMNIQDILFRVSEMYAPFNVKLIFDTAIPHLAPSLGLRFAQRRRGTRICGTAFGLVYASVTC